MKKILNEWRKYLAEVDTDDDGYDDADELAAIGPGDLEGEESKEISPRSKEWIGLTITGHFNDYAARIRSLNPQRDPENQKRLAPLFAKDLRAVDDEEKRNPFYKAVYLDDIIPEGEQGRVVELLKKLADAIEDDPTLLDAREIGKKGDWTAVAEKGEGESTGQVSVEEPTEEV